MLIIGCRHCSPTGSQLNQPASSFDMKGSHDERISRPLGSASLGDH